MGLFNHFLDRLIHTESTPLTPEQLLSHHDLKERFLEDFEQYEHLITLQKTRQLVEVWVLNRKNSFQSMITHVDLMDKSLRLDAFSPTLNSPESLINQRITIRHQQRWQKLEITSTIIGWSDKEQCYILSLPEYAAYQPRRTYPRLLLTHNVLKTQISPLYGAPWYATVKDISRGGMRINISGDLRPHLHRDKLLPKCQVILDNSISIQCRGLVRGYSYVSKPYRHTEISIEFQNMNHSDQTDLRRFIDYVEVAA
jgi:c-di-GMP-binding flagellar brake protein YcgR